MCAPRRRARSSSSSTSMAAASPIFMPARLASNGRQGCGIDQAERVEPAERQPAQHVAAASRARRRADRRGSHRRRSRSRSCSTSRPTPCRRGRPSSPNRDATDVGRRAEKVIEDLRRPRAAEPALGACRRSIPRCGADRASPRRRTRRRARIDPPGRAAPHRRALRPRRGRRPDRCATDGAARAG